MALPHFSCDLYNLQATPKPEENKAEGCQDHVLGDLHSNHIKLIHFLVRKNILSFKNKSDYQTLRRKSSADFINYFSENAQINIEVLKKNKIILIGDELADRGTDDTLILFILMCLGFADVLDIILSNHGFEFIRWYEKIKNSTIFSKIIDTPPALSIHSTQKPSLIHLQDAIQKDPALWDVIEELVETYYKPCLKVFSYSLNKDKDGTFIITLYGHADFGVERIQEAVDLFNKNRRSDEEPITFDDTTAETLANTIDQVNRVFQTRYVKQNKIHTLTDLEDKTNPIYQIMWSRDHGTFKQPHDHKGYKIFYGSGHDTPKSSIKKLNHVYHLDNEFGSGRINVARSPEVIVPTTRTPHLKLERLSSPPKKPKEKSFFSRLKTTFHHFTEQYPKLWWAIKWIGIPAAIASAIVLSGGLAAIPGVGTAVLSWTGSIATTALIKTIMDIALVTFALNTLQFGYVTYQCLTQNKKVPLEEPLSQLIPRCKKQFLDSHPSDLDPIVHISGLLPHTPPSQSFSTPTPLEKETKTILPATSEQTPSPQREESVTTPQKTAVAGRQY